MFQSLADEVLIQQHIDPQSDTSTVRNGTALDMTGWDGVLFILTVGAMGGSGTVDLKIQSAAVSAFTTPHDIASAALVTVLAATGASKFYTIDVKTATMTAAQSGDVFMRAVMTPAVAASLLGVVAIRYRRSGTLPVAVLSGQAIKV